MKLNLDAPRQPRLTVLQYVVTLIFLCMAQGKSHGADAFFSSDGKTVTLVFSQVFDVDTQGHHKLREPAALARVDISTGTITTIPLPKTFAEADISSIAQGAEGEIFFLALDAVWVLKGTEPPREVCKTTPLKKADHLIIVTQQDSEMKDWMFVSDEGLIHVRKPGEMTFGKVLSRRAGSVLSGAFARDGRFVFLNGDDIWEGRIGKPGFFNDLPAVLTASRVAPITIHSTDEGNASAMYASAIVTDSEWIYARLHGHHLGALVRTPLPPTPSKYPSISDQYKTMSRALAKTEVIVGDDEWIGHLCAWSNKSKTRLFYTTRHALMLWEGHGKPKAIGEPPLGRF